MLSTDLRVLEIELMIPPPLTCFCPKCCIIFHTTIQFHERGVWQGFVPETAIWNRKAWDIALLLPISLMQS